MDTWIGFIQIGLLVGILIGGGAALLRVIYQTRRDMASLGYRYPTGRREHETRKD